MYAFFGFSFFILVHITHLNMDVVLGYTLEDFLNIPENTPMQPVTSMCIVLAGSGVINLLS